MVRRAVEAGNVMSSSPGFILENEKHANRKQHLPLNTNNCGVTAWVMVVLRFKTLPIRVTLWRSDPAHSMLLRPRANNSENTANSPPTSGRHAGRCWVWLVTHSGRPKNTEPFSDGSNFRLGTLIYPLFYVTTHHSERLNQVNRPMARCFDSSSFSLPTIQQKNKKASIRGVRPEFSPASVFCTVFFFLSLSSRSKDGENVSEIDSLRDRYKIIKEERKFIISRALESDAGSYTCSVRALNASRTFNVVGKFRKLRWSSWINSSTVFLVHKIEKNFSNNDPSNIVKSSRFEDMLRTTIEPIQIFWGFMMVLTTSSKPNWLQILVWEIRQILKTRKTIVADNFFNIFFYGLVYEAFKLLCLLAYPS